MMRLTYFKNMNLLAPSRRTYSTENKVSKDRGSLSLPVPKHGVIPSVRTPRFPVNFHLSTYKKARNIRVVLKYFNLMDKNVFKRKVYKALLKDRPLTNGKRYSTFVKIQFNKTEYRTGGTQFGFVLHSYKSLDSLHINVIKRVNVFIEDYEINIKDVVHVIIEFIPVKAGLIADFGLSEKNLSNTKIQDYKKELGKLSYIPLSTNIEHAIAPINIEITNGLVTNIPIQVKDRVINLLDKIKEQDKYLLLRKTIKYDITNDFDSRWKFFLIEGSKFPYVIAYRIDNDSTVTKVCYSVNGVTIDRVVDKAFKDNYIVRYVKKL